MNEHGPTNPPGLGIDPVNGKQGFKCHPNPFNTQINIQFDREVTEISCYDLTGRLIFIFKPQKEDRLFIWNGRDMQNGIVPAGIYILKLKTKTELKTMKVVKQQ
jgi:hypothetical protein